MPGRARVPGDWPQERGTARRQFHDTLHETDENDDMHRIPTRANMAFHRFLSGLYTASTRLVRDSGLSKPHPEGGLREAYGKLKVSVW